MAFVALGMRPWILLMRSRALHPRVLADDILHLAFDDSIEDQDVLKPLVEAYDLSAVSGFNAISSGNSLRACVRHSHANAARVRSRTFTSPTRV